MIWSSPAGKKLKESMELSVNAKKFAIAREVLYLCQDEVEKKTLINFCK